jgi:hypothetical protein
MLTLADLSTYLAIIGPEQRNTLASIDVQAVSLPGKGIYITNDLAIQLKSLGRRVH